MYRKYQPEFKTPETIADEAFGLLKQFNADYLYDLSIKVDTYDFINRFVPMYIKKTYGEDIFVEIIKFPSEEKDIAGYSTYKGITLNNDYFDSDNNIEIFSSNWTMVHEAYHSIFHRKYLLSDLNQPTLNGINPNKVDKITTLKRDLKAGQSKNKINAFCYQANAFAGYWLIPRKRIKAALQEIYNKEVVEFDSREYKGPEDGYKKIASEIRKYFDLNIQPLTIALKKYNLARDINQKQASLW